MADPALLLTSLLSDAFDGADPSVRRSEHADYQANGALAVAKRARRDAVQTASEIAERARPALVGVATIEVADRGFLNIYMDSSWLADNVRKLTDDPLLGVRGTPTPETVVVDYSAPNVAKEMHIGHLRSTIIGDALVRLLTFVGHRVIRENHIGDWGLAFGMLIEHLLDIGEARASEELSVGDLTAFYQQARVKFDSDEDFAARSRQRVVLLQSGDEVTMRLWKILVDESASYFKAVYDELGVLLEPDDIVGESFYNDMLVPVVDDLRASGLLVESDGAQCVFPPGYSGRDGTPLPLIVQNSVGGFGYAATDLATVRDRVDRLGASWMLYVVGAPQATHLSMVWDVSTMAGWLEPPARCVHVGFGSVLGDDRRMYRTRSGETVRLLDLLREAVDRAEAVIIEKNPAIAGAERAEVAAAVGIGAVKYADLSNDRIKDYVFSFDRMLAFEGNTGPYLQYAHARARAILRKATSAQISDDPKLIIAEPTERALALALLSFDAAVWDTINDLRPHRLCSYLFKTAQTFTAFYDACPVLRSDVAIEVQQSRLELCRLTAEVLHLGLSLLGITATERM